MKVRFFFLLISIFVSKGWALDGVGPIFRFPATIGHIDVVGTTLDMSKLSIQIALYCHKGWGDGIKNCGSVHSQSKVDALGNFEFAELVGKDPNYYGFFYHLEYNGARLVSAPWEIRSQKDINDIQEMFRAMTLVVMEPFDMQLTSANGQDFKEWNRTVNRSSNQMVRFNVTTADNTKMQAWLPELYKVMEFESSRQKTSRFVFLLPGLKSNLASTYSMVVDVMSCSGCIYKSLEVYRKSWPLDFPKLISNISVLPLETDRISLSIDGHWQLSIDPSFEVPGEEYFIQSDPAVSISAKCIDGKLVGDVYFQYFRFKENAKYNKTEPLVGTCGNGFAKTKLSFLMLSYAVFLNEQKSFPFDAEVIFEDIRGNGMNIKYLDPAGKQYSDSGQRCENGFLYDERGFNRCP